MGATKTQIMATYLMEFALLGLGAGLVAALCGTLAAWALWAGLGCLAGGAFSIFEGVKGWCVVRALGFKTPM